MDQLKLSKRKGKNSFYVFQIKGNFKVIKKEGRNREKGKKNQL